jgi:hypothetical protein
LIEQDFGWLAQCLSGCSHLRIGFAVFLSAAEENVFHCYTPPVTMGQILKGLCD